MSPKEATPSPPPGTSTSAPPSTSPSDWEPQIGKKRGRPRMNDSEIMHDPGTSKETKSKIIYRRKYAREYREKIRADLQTKEELREMLIRMEVENKQLKTTLDDLRSENHRILNNLVQSSLALQSLAVSRAPFVQQPFLPFNPFPPQP
ncbi:hypothetical protein L596_007055 [Steinernema carpocapsae]|uniref:BZIP domain-containing protein n=2 Tax=Steinernema carpocapsae TaxID=34508 RepID=A0A4U5P820_STECR|nr:hypothetical protein L596_007055 [Steinernema carpocapsae]